MRIDAVDFFYLSMPEVTLAAGVEGVPIHHRWQRIPPRLAPPG